MTSETPVSMPERLYSLDVLRGFAALSVVLWHWQHFFMGAGQKSAVAFEPARQPFYEYLSLFYTKGWLAVDLFFVISGFVFYWLYADKIKQSRTSFRDFALFRLSRLYPLHFATLVIVGLLQIWYAANNGGNSFVYLYNDARHLFLNVGFASSWGLERGFSFNGPAWSVSVEILLYLLFFLVTRLFSTRLSVALTIAVIGFFVLSRLYNPLGRGIGGFFMGGASFIAFRYLLASGRLSASSQFAGAAAICAWLATIIIAFLAQQQTPTAPNPSFMNEILQAIGPKTSGRWMTFVLFPLTILSLALWETGRGHLGKRMAFVGEISYSSYLLHFPLQLIVVILVGEHLDVESRYDLFYSKFFLVCFYVALVAVSFASFRYFENPMQNFLRQKTKGTNQLHATLEAGKT